MTEVFISYKKEDLHRVTPIAQAIANAGYDVWWDHRIPPGRTYRDVIGAALTSAKCVVVVWSKLSANAQWVLDEADEGKKRNVLLPLLIDDVEPPYGFRQIEAARLVGWSGDTTDPEWEGALASVANFVGREPGAPRPLQTPRFENAQTRESAPAPRVAPGPRHTNLAGPLIGLALVVALVAAGYFTWRGGMFESAQQVGEAPVTAAETEMSTPLPAEEETPSPPATDETPAPRQQAAAPACYWLSNQTRVWQHAPHLATIDQCFAQDSCNGGLGQSNGGCYKWASAADAARQPWPATYACYWLSNQTRTWQRAQHLTTIEQCFAQDSCNGGLGQSRGGCYKWAAGPDAPRRPWP